MSIDNEFGEFDANEAAPQRLLPRTIEDVLRAWTLRGGGVALIASACLIWAAMLTWSANDPSLSINTSEPAQNLLGAPGAVIADFLFHTLGLSVVFFVVPPLVLGLQLALGDAVSDLRRRLILFAIASVAIAGGCSALPLRPYWPMEQLGYGGIIGDFAYNVVGGIVAEAAPGAGGAIAGILYFTIGFWAFSRAICIDRYNVFAVQLPGIGATFAGRVGAKWRRRSAARAAVRLKEAHAAAGHRVREPGLEHRQFAEPEPPAWTFDARLHEYAPGADEAGQGRSEPANPSQAAAGRAEHHTVLLDDEGLDPVKAEASSDLPNVLKRARREAAELLPPELAVKILSPETFADEIADRRRAVAPPPLPPFPTMAAERERRNANSGLVGQIRSLRTADASTATGAAPKIVASGYRRPSLNLLKAQRAVAPSADTSPSVLQGRARMLEDVLADFRIKGGIRDVRPGPVITLFELEPARGTKSARVIALADDVARSMSAASARIAVVPGRNAIGIELPNTRRETFGLRELIDSQTFVDSNAKLPLVLGKGIGGEPVLADLARMPHLLVAGTTGSGKSVGVNAMILSLIYRLGPQDCRFLMIDPKMLELSAYNGIPHLLTPVITDPQKAITALSWAVGEMEERYKRMAELGVRSIDAFNNRVRHASRTGEKLGRTVQTGFDPSTGEAVFEEMSMNAKPLPYIVIVVDEFADLMAVAGKEIEALVQRLAQMARAAGIHMIMATQRPSVDVVTGTIKANFPTRISYRVASRIDSRTILNEQGGEQLLGQGDMLFLNESGSVQRVHGPFVSDEEVEAVANALTGTYPTDYVGDVLSGLSDMAAVEVAGSGSGAGAADTSDDPYDRAVELVLRDQKASTSYLQRRLAIGYNRAADLIDRMEAEGVIGAADHAGRREILLAG